MKFGRLLVAAIAMAGIAGCSTEIPVVSQSSLENQLFEKLAKEWGHNPQKVVCPAGLRGEVDAKQKCVATDDGVDHMVTATVVKVDGKNVDFKLDTGESKPMPNTNPSVYVSREELARSVAERIIDQIGKPADSVNCPDDLPAQVGAKTTCYIHEGADVYDAVATVSQVNGDDINYDVQVAATPR